MINYIKNLQRELDGTKWQLGQEARSQRPIQGNEQEEDHELHDVGRLFFDELQGWPLQAPRPVPAGKWLTSNS